MNVVDLIVRRKFRQGANLNPLFLLYDISNLGLNSTLVDSWLKYHSAHGTTLKILDIRGNQKRTSASDAAVLALTNAGCEVWEDVFSISLSANSIAENNAIGAIIGALSATNNSFINYTYSLVSGTGSTDNASFTITGANLKAGIAFDYETKSSYSVRIRAAATGFNIEQVFAITITDVNEELNATLTANGTGAGVSTLKMQVSENQTFTITSGNARFYTDAAGTLGESTTWSPTTGALRTIYLKAPSGSSILNIPKPDKVTKWGDFNIDGWISSTNAASISIAVGSLALTHLQLIGTSTLSGALPNGLTHLNLAGDKITWTYSGALPNGLTYIQIAGDLINWTGLNIGSGSNVTVLNLYNRLTSKMNSTDMLTFLNQLTNRTGTLPTTIRIGDYADAASPPAEVLTAIDTLKSTKSITNVIIGVTL